MILTRFKYGEKETIGRLVFDSGFFWTVENPWLDNKPFDSCIPEGLYYLERYNSPSHGDGTWQFINVPDRTHVQIHVANYASDVSGCIGLGNSLMNDLGGVGSSRDAIAQFSALVAETQDLQITIRSEVLR
jgi:hypothetical protein